MHVALMLDEQHVRTELALVNRTIVGLMASGIRVTRLVPDTPVDEFQEESESRVSLTRRIEIPATALPWLGRWRADRLAESLERDPPDLILVVGFRNLILACRLAALLDIPCAVEIWSRDEIRGLPRGRHAQSIAAYIARTSPLGDALRSVVDPDLVAVVPVGVAVPADIRRDEAGPMQRTTGIAIIGTGRDLPAYTAMLAGIRELINRVPETSLFLELGDENDQIIWRVARSHHLLGHLSTFQHAAAHRTLLTHCDLLIAPERIGLVRSILPEVMAWEIPVIAADDPMLDVLRDGVTARVIDADDPVMWAENLLELVKHPEHARALGVSARTWVQQRHSSSRSIMRLAEVITTIIHGETYHLDSEGPSGSPRNV